MKLLPLYFASPSWSVELRHPASSPRSKEFAKPARPNSPAAISRRMRRRGGRHSPLVLLFLAFFTLTCHAHKPSEAYLNVAVTNGLVAGQWDLALRDLEDSIGLDANGDGGITWGEVRSRQADIAAHVFASLQILAEGKPLILEPGELLIDEHSDGVYAVLRFQAALTGTPKELTIIYNLFFDFDPLHRGLLQLRQGALAQTGVFSPEHREQTFTLEKPPLARQFLAFAREGVHHIWMGHDHVLFLLALLLPAVLWRSKSGQGEPSPLVGPVVFQQAFIAVVRLVTAFTIAHSLTLGLAALDIVRLPSRLVESVIAASVVVAALNNLRPFFKDRAEWVAFGFGLVHGFGFASVLQDLGLTGGSVLIGLAGFNFGVEAGQLMIVAIFLPTAFLLRSSWFYRNVVCVGGSTLILMIAAGWLVERVFDFQFLPF